MCWHTHTARLPQNNEGSACRQCLKWRWAAVEFSRISAFQCGHRSFPGSDSRIRHAWRAMAWFRTTWCADSCVQSACSLCLFHRQHAEARDWWATRLKAQSKRQLRGLQELLEKIKINYNKIKSTRTRTICVESGVSLSASSAIVYIALIATRKILPDKLVQVDILQGDHSHGGVGLLPVDCRVAAAIDDCADDAGLIAISDAWRLCAPTDCESRVACRLQLERDVRLLAIAHFGRMANEQHASLGDGRLILRYHRRGCFA